MQNTTERDRSGTVRGWLVLPVLGGLLASGLMACGASQVRASLLKEALGTWVCRMSVDKSNAPEYTGERGSAPRVYDVVVTIGEELDVAAGGDAGVGKLLQVSVRGQGQFGNYRGDGTVFVNPPFEEGGNKSRTLSISYHDSLVSDANSTMVYPPNDVQGLDDSLGNMTLGQIGDVGSVDQPTGVRMPLQIDRKSKDHVIIGYVDPNPYYVEVIYSLDCLKGVPADETGQGATTIAPPSTTVPVTTVPETTVTLPPETTLPPSDTVLPAPPVISSVRGFTGGLEISGSGFGNLGELTAGVYPCIAIVDVTQGVSAGHINANSGEIGDRGMVFGPCFTQVDGDHADPIPLHIVVWRDDLIAVERVQNGGAGPQPGDILRIYISNGEFGGPPEVVDYLV